MILRLTVALALAAAAQSAAAADLLTIYRDARVSDPVYQAARAQYAATREKLPQARAGEAQLRGGHGDDRRYARGAGALRPVDRQGDRRHERPRGEDARARGAHRHAPYGARGARRALAPRAAGARRRRGVGEGGRRR